MPQPNFLYTNYNLADAQDYHPSQQQTTEFSELNDFFKFLQQTFTVYRKQASQNMKLRQYYYKEKYYKSRCDTHYNIVMC